jgi:hypothetical protein
MILGQQIQVGKVVVGEMWVTVSSGRVFIGEMWATDSDQAGCC